MGRTAKNGAARTRAREALAAKQKARRERDARLEQAATAYFTAADKVDAAKREAAEAVRALVEENEPRSDIAELLGISTREIKASLDLLYYYDLEFDSDYEGTAGSSGEASGTGDDTSHGDATTGGVGAA